MKKFLLSLGVACMTLSTFASTRVLYMQNFETAPDADATGWSYGGASMSIASDSFGKFLELSQGQTNGRSAQVTWGANIFLNEDGTPALEEEGETLPYNLKFDFSIVQGSNNQYNGEFTVFTNHAPIANNKYRNPWSQKPEASCWDNYLFDMTQWEEKDADGKVVAHPTEYVIDAPTVVTEGADGVKTYGVDFSDPKTFTPGTWYTVSLEVNTVDRKVDYSVVDLEGNEVQSGTREVPAADINGDPISMYAEGLFILVARYQTIIDIDNIMISYESKYDRASKPTIALTRVGQTADEQLDLAMRAYSITFLEGETLHVTGTDGKTEEVEYADCDGNYAYETTTSGKLQAWTTSGTATSEVVEVAVDCNPIVLPEVVATISSVSEGFGKTYTLTVSNADVPLRPTIFINYEFIGANGEKVSAEGQASGCKVTVSEEGTLKLTSEAYGYESKSCTVENNSKFETKKVWDFARLTEDELKAAGFPAFETLNSSKTSGFDNWTARKRLYYELAGSEHENEEGATVRDNVYPFGFLAEDNDKNVIKYAVIDNTGKETVDSESYFEGLSIFPDKGKKDDGFPNVCMMYHIGLYNNETKNNNNNVIVKGLEPTDFVVVNTIDNYGGDSNHPICATDEEYFAQLAGVDYVYPAVEETKTEGEGDNQTTVGTGVWSVSYPLYRIQTAITKITVFKQADNAVEGIEAAEVAGDNYYYTIDGLRLAEPTRPGLYIHNGKKIIVK